MWVLCVISTMTEDLKAVIFDLGGVVYDSPFSGIAEVIESPLYHVCVRDY